MNSIRQFISALKIFTTMMIISCSAVAATSDYKKLAYIDQTLIVGFGLSYSKMETYTTVGNYFLLSQTNPRLDIRYISKIEEKFRHSFHGYFVRELYNSENSNLVLSSHKPLNRFGLTYQPSWFSEGGGVSYGFNLQLKQANVYSELPRPNLLAGSVAQRLSYEAGVAVKWYGQTVAKLPMSLDLDFSYVNHFVVNGDTDYREGIAYRLALDFDFRRRSYFSNFNFRAFYENETIKSDFEPMTSKEFGVSLARAFSF